MSCDICQHPQRQAIDRALMAKSDTLETLSQKFSLSTSALHRHKAHLQAKIQRAKTQVQDNLLHGCYFWLTQALEMSMQTAQAAQAEGNLKVVLQALAQGTRFIKTIMKGDFHLDDRIIYEILTSSEWAKTGTFSNDPQILAAGRHAVSENLLTPCSDQEPPPPSPAPAGDLDQDMLQGLISALSQSSVPQPLFSDQDGQSPEKSQKLLGDTIFKYNKSKPKQKNKHGKQNVLNSPSTSPGAWLDALDAGRLDLDTLSAIGAGRNPVF